MMGAAPAVDKGVEKPPTAVKGALKQAKASQVAPKPEKRTSGAVNGAAVDCYGFRADSLKAKAAAMYANKAGATVGEVRASLGGLHLNLLTTLEKNGYSIKREKEKGPGGRLVTRYFLSGK